MGIKMLKVTAISGSSVTIGNVYNGTTTDTFTVTTSDCYSSPVVGDWVVKYTTTMTTNGVEETVIRINKINHLDQPYTSDELSDFIKTYNACLDKQAVLIEGSYCIINPWEYYSSVTHVIEIDEDALDEHALAKRSIYMDSPSLVSSRQTLTQQTWNTKCQIYTVSGNQIYKADMDVVNEFTISDEFHGTFGEITSGFTALGFICARPKVKVQLQSSGNYALLRELFIFSGCQTTLSDSALPKNNSSLEALVLLGDNVVNLTSSFWNTWDSLLTNNSRTIYVEDKMLDYYKAVYGTQRNIQSVSDYGITDQSWITAFNSAVVQTRVTQLSDAVTDSNEARRTIAGTPPKFNEITSGDILTGYNTTTGTTQTKVVSTLAYVSNSRLMKQLTNGQWETTTDYAVPFVEIVAPVSTYNTVFTANDIDNICMGACPIVNTSVCCNRPILTDRGYKYFEDFIEYASEINMRLTLSNTVEDTLNTVDEVTMTQVNNTTKVVCQFISDGVTYKVTGDLFIFNINNYNSIKALFT